MKRVWGVAVAAVLLASACSSSSVDSVVESMTPAPVETYTAKVAPDWTPEPESSEEAEDDADFSISGVLPDPQIMATMTCEPLSETAADALADFWGGIRPENAVMVEVGEGLTPGERWWIIAYTDTPRSAFWDGRQWLTNAPAVMEGREAKWIDSGGVYIQERNATFNGALAWDRARVARAQSALATAVGCLESGHT